jgi:AGZA family xanthine/uracil permease-like MFS transporter
MHVLDRWFDLPGRGSTVARELRGAVATFLTMAYILFVNPQILAAAGVPQDSAVACTAAAAGVCCVLMGLWANFPLALASGMGLNGFVAFTLVKQAGLTWQTAMGLVVLDGLLILLLVLAGLREAVMRAIPRDLRLAIGAGIGLFIAFIGLQHARVVIDDPVTLVRFGSLRDATTAVSAIGVVITAALVARRVPGALVLGILATTAIAFAWDAAVGDRAGGLGLIARWPPAFAAPDFSAAFQADVRGALQWRLVPLLLSLVMVDFFDTLGSVTAVAEQAGLMDADGRVPGIRRILIVDSLGASIGGAFGASSVTSYIESAAGVAEGARTGLHTVLVGLLFLLAIFAAPLAGIVPPAATAPALILVGFLMIAQVATLDFARLDTAIPAFVTLLTIPLTFSISHGIGYGFLSLVLIKTLSGKPREVHPLMWLTAGAFGAYFVWGS